MAQADPYGLLASGLPPEIAAQARGLTRRQAIAEAMLAHADAPLETNRMAGGYVIPISPFEGLAKIGQAYFGAKEAKETDKKWADLGGQYQNQTEAAIKDYMRTKNGAPERSAVMDPQEVEQQADQGTPAPANIPAQTADPRAAVMQALASRNPVLKQIAGMDYTQLTKPPEKYDAGDKWILQRDGVTIGTIPKAATPDAVMKETGAAQRHLTPSGGDILKNDTSKELHATASGSTLATIANSSEQGNLNRGVTMRGQDLTNQRAIEMQGVNPDGTLTPESEQMAQAIAKGQLAPLSGFALQRPGGRAVMSRVMEVNPSYSAADFAAAKTGVNAFASGKQGNTIRSFNTALAHLDTLSGLSDALQNGNVQVFNKLGNEYARASGQPAPTNFESARKIVGDEIVKAIVGSGGGVHDREEAAKTISAASSPAKLRGVINTYKELMKGQLTGLRQQYKASTGRDDFDKFLANPPSGEAASAPGGWSVVR